MDDIVMEEIKRVTTLLRRVMVRKAPPKMWREFVGKLPEEDDAEADALQTVTRDLIGLDFFIHYVGGDDRESARHIMIQNLGYCGDALALSAYCHMREARRTFLAARIQKMTDLQTGEVINDPYKWLSLLSAQSPTAEALERSAAGLQILACLAWCDGHLNEDEWEVMLRFVDSNATTLGLRWDVIEAFVKCVRPSLRAYDRAVRRLNFQGWKEARNIAAAGRELVLADGVLTLEETELMEPLSRYLGD